MADPCESCVHFDYHYESDCYECDMELDEDEMLSFLSGHFDRCPYYELYDEYKLVRKQN